MKNIINHLPDSFGMKKGAEEFPLMVVVGFSYVCNARCPSCPYTTTTLRNNYSDALFIEDSLFKKIADECGKYSAFIRISGGGEPMLHPHAVELIKYAKSVGAKVGLITNGSKLNKKSIEELVKANVDAIEFSVDAGNSAEYLKVRPGLKWNKLVDNVTYVRSFRDSFGSSTKLVTSIINQIGVDVNLAKDFWSNIADNVQIRKYLTWGYNEDNSADNTPYLEPADRIPCPWLFERINIDSRGAVTICGEDIAFKYKFADVTVTSIQDVWHSPEMEELRKLHLLYRGDEHPACKTCPDWKYRSWEHNYWKLIK
jgi:radical SAM protein with 4Fe4S-binding SPASM domain